MSRTGFSRPAAHRGRSEVGNEEVTVIELRGSFSLTAFQAQIASIDRCGVVGSVVTIVLIFINFRAGFRCAEKKGSSKGVTMNRNLRGRKGNSEETHAPAMMFANPTNPWPAHYNPLKACPFSGAHAPRARL